jgi:glycerol kinase
MEKDLGRRMQTLRVDGGAAANDLLMQTQADYLGRKLVRPQMLETTVAGASYLAGMGVGLWGQRRILSASGRRSASLLSSSQPGVASSAWILAGGVASDTDA